MKNSELPKDFKRILDYLRNAKVSLLEGVVAEKRVEIFKGEQLTSILTGESFKVRFPNITICNKKESHEILQTLLDFGAYTPVLHNKGRYYQPTMSRKWSDDNMYAWLYEGSQIANVVYGLAALAAVICMLLYPLWPTPLKSISWYVLMALASFVAFILILSVVRLVVFTITYLTLKPGIWLFPNLFADVGFVESFIPVYSWNS